MPWSSNFRAQLLQGGDVSPELTRRFDEIKPSRERVQAAKGWKSSPPPSKAKKSENTTPGMQNNKPNAQIAKTSPPPATVPVTPPKLTPSKKIVTKETPVEKVKSVTVAEIAPSKSSYVAPQMTVEDLLAEQRYYSSLLKWTYRNLKYPNRSKKREEQGSVRFSVTIDRSGNILSQTLLNRSRYKLLNKSALKAINKSEPFPEVPGNIRG